MRVNYAIALFFGQLVDMATFGSFAIAAILARRRTETHKRLILLATLGILAAAVGRILVLGRAAD